MSEDTRLLPAGKLPFEEVKDQIEQGLRDAEIRRRAEEMRRAIVKTAEIEQLVQFPGLVAPSAGPEE